MLMDVLFFKTAEIYKSLQLLKNIIQPN